MTHPLNQDAIAAICASIPEPKVLRLLNKLIGDRLLERHEATQHRVRENKLITQCAARGDRVCLVWSGQDCDGVSYSGSVQYVEATRAAVDAAIEHEYECAEGITRYWLTTPADAADIRYSSRDLVLCAFEDGHPHYLHYGDY